MNASFSQVNEAIMSSQTRSRDHSDDEDEDDNTSEVFLDDKELLKQAKTHYNEEQLLASARLLRKVKDRALLGRRKEEDPPDFQNILDNAKIIEQAVDDLLSDPFTHGGWKINHNHNASYNTTIYHKIVKQEAGLFGDNIPTFTCRVETPVSSDLLIPLLSVLNESSLYDTWIPSWKKPFQLGISKSEQLFKASRGHQIIRTQLNLPWPLKAKEVLMDVTAVDDIDSQGFIIAKLRTLKDATSTIPKGFTIPELPKNVVRTDFDGALLFRPCPKDHPNYESTRFNYPEEHLILLQYTISLPLSGLPPFLKGLVDFITEKVIIRVWNMLLRVAEEVRDGKRSDHLQAIEEKSESYDWMHHRCQILLHGRNQLNQDPTNASPST